MTVHWNIAGNRIRIHLRQNPESAASDRLNQRPIELVGWIVVSVTAGFCEEYFFAAIPRRADNDFRSNQK
jgi:hypothetical protein